MRAHGFSIDMMVEIVNAGLASVTSERVLAGGLKMEVARVRITEAGRRTLAYEMTGGNVKDLSLDQIDRLMTITQHVTDLCLNEIERRGQLIFLDGSPVVPYCSDYMVETVLTRSRI